MWLSSFIAGVTDSSARSRKWVRHTAVLIPIDGRFNTVVGWDGSRKERDQGRPRMGSASDARHGRCALPSDI
jgi:hypothetical protein